MPNDQLKEYLAIDTAMNALKAVPDVVMESLNAHLELYRKNPEAAHRSDPALIGVPDGPVKTLMRTYTGRKSGKTLQTALQYFERDGKVAIVASRGGTEDHPLWYQNLVAEPKRQCQIGKRACRAIARTAEGADRDAWWKVILVDQPIQTVYQDWTSRLIPVVIMDIFAGRIAIRIANQALFNHERPCWQSGRRAAAPRPDRVRNRPAAPRHGSSRTAVSMQRLPPLPMQDQ